MPRETPEDQVSRLEGELEACKLMLEQRKYALGDAKIAVAAMEAQYNAVFKRLIKATNNRARGFRDGD